MQFVFVMEMKINDNVIEWVSNDVHHLLHVGGIIFRPHFSPRTLIYAEPTGTHAKENPKSHLNPVISWQEIVTFTTVPFTATK
mmetsp:Transcript_34908/g.42693  ORF Transcript_34908/g.42693 Transcript_34908/m.42693 type:complete len:83 (+) Transcript_34908:480-728(+)